MQLANSSHAGGYLLANLVHFGRLLRRAGIMVSSAQISDLAQGLTHIDLSKREDFFHATRGFLLNDPEKFVVITRIFDLYWSGKIEWMIDLAATTLTVDQPAEVLPDSDQSILRRESHSRQKVDDDGSQNSEETSIRATYSPIERLYRKNFTEFDPAELEIAKSIVSNLVWSLDQRLSRRKVRATKRAKDN